MLGTSEPAYYIVDCRISDELDFSLLAKIWLCYQTGGLEDFTFLIPSPPFPPLPDFLLPPSPSDFQAFRRILVIAPGKKEITITIIAPGRRGASKALDIY